MLRSVHSKLDSDLQLSKNWYAEAIDQCNSLKKGRENLEKAIEVCLTAANRWTAHIFTLQQWCSSNFPEAKEQLEHFCNELGITDDFDNLELPPAAFVSPVGDQAQESSPK